MGATRVGSVGMVRKMIQCGANVNLTNKVTSDWTPCRMFETPGTLLWGFTYACIMMCLVQPIYRFTLFDSGTEAISMRV